MNPSRADRAIVITDGRPRRRNDVTDWDGVLHRVWERGREGERGRGRGRGRGRDGEGGGKGRGRDRGRKGGWIEGLLEVE